MKRIARIVRALRAGPELRLRMLRAVGTLLLPGYRFCWPQLSWWHDAPFNAYLDRFGEREGMNTDRHWTLGELLRLVRDVPGDTAECGVFAGASSYLMAAFGASDPRHDRHHHMFDSFAGLSPPAAQDGSHWRAGDLGVGIDTVMRKLAGFKNVHAYQGWIPARFDEVAQRSFSFVHVDVDLYQPTRDSIAFFYPRLSPGGILVCDDYGFTSCPGATAAIDEFLADRPEKMILLSCGSGLLIRGTATAPQRVAG